MTGKRSTISDVALHAGVSKATVSAVLNETGSVKDATRDRVLAAIERLNYRPTQATGRGAAARKGKCIALVIKEHDNPYYAQVIDGVRAATDAAGYTLLVISSEGKYEIERRAVELVRDKDVDGLIVTPVVDEHADLSHFFELKRRNCPFVLLEEIRGVPASLVDLDNVEASRTAVEYLIGLGHTRVVHFAGPAYSTHSQERVDGVRLAFSRSHLAVRDDGIVPAGAHLADGYRAGLAYFGERLGAADRPTAVTCYNDLVAVGLCRALADLGLRVPEDVSVVGYDDVPLCEYLAAPLTTVRVPKVEMGETAARMLLRHIESKQAIPLQKVYLDGALVVRRTTSAPGQPAQDPPPALSPHETHLATSGA
ncbi:MAG TPA: LacI family DNA-binding transcriptional regulator [Gemmatimonadaceae bacterium]|nr:LacI family DNA-binding transcriptional regulator [Gemmatimonadaceae bacterium]